MDKQQEGKTSKKKPETQIIVGGIFFFLINSYKQKHCLISEFFLHFFW